MEHRDSLSIFFPAYNDWGTIASMVTLAHQVARRLTDDFEVIVVNDASIDHVEFILEELARIYPDTFRKVTHEFNRGYGGALRSGFAAATQEFVFYTDGDAQYDVRELPLLWKERRNADLVTGYKIRRSDPLHRILVGRAYQTFTRWIFRFPARDVDCDFRLIHRRVFETIRLEENSGLICVELLTRTHRSGYRIAEVPVHHFHRMHGRSQFFNLSRVARVLWAMLRFWWKINFVEPRRSRSERRDGVGSTQRSGS
jgi:glycosyltransferase involved in cell wall biosynthesis